MAGLRNLNRSYPQGRVCDLPYVGVLASEVPTTGIDGPSYYSDHPSFPVDLGQRVAARITTPPSAGSFYGFADGSFIFLGPDGVYSVGYQFYINGVATGSETFFTITQGTGVRVGSGVSASGLALSAATTKNGISTGAGRAGLVASATATKASSTSASIAAGLTGAGAALKKTSAGAVSRCGTMADSIGLGATNDAKSGAAAARFGQAGAGSGTKATGGAGAIASGFSCSAIGARGAAGTGVSSSGSVAFSLGAAGSGAGASAAQIWAYEVAPGVTAAQALAALYARETLTATAVENAIFDRLVEAGMTYEQIIRIIAASAAGKTQKSAPDAGGNVALTITGIDGVTPRIAGTIDAENNRTAATYDGS